jgi:muramoyltetrapeptide carboxypeptidase
MNLKQTAMRFSRQQLIDGAIIVAVLILIIVKLCMAHFNSIIYPAPLKQGDKIAILAPAGLIQRGQVDSAATVLRQLGYVPVIYPHTFGEYGSYSGTIDERWADLKAAFTNPEIRAILCARGGYGVVHNLQRLNELPLRDDPKWVIGFSDISALHALMASHGIASIHSSMTKALAHGMSDPNNIRLLKILGGQMPMYKFAAHAYNHTGRAEGQLLGGNLAVLADLINTPYDIIKPGTILFIEDVSEPVYKIERIMYQLRFSGVLPNLKGLIIGQFTDYKPDENNRRIEDMIHELVADYDFPIAFNVPVGHVDNNVPLVESSHAVLDVQADGVTLTLSH